MELHYELRNGVGILTTPQMQEFDENKEIQFTFPLESGIMELNKCVKIALVDGKVVIPAKNLFRGTNLIKLVSGGKTYPCQPINYFSDLEAMKVTLATSLDLISTVEVLQDVVSKLQERVKALETASPEKTRVTLNELVEAVKGINDRLNELEAGYDPTVINQ